jgi:hypothetical protein
MDGNLFSLLWENGWLFVLSTALRGTQLSISQALGTLPEDGNVMPKYGGDTIHN